MDKTAETHNAPQNARNSAARLMAVQAVYQLLTLSHDKPDQIIREYLHHRAGMDVDGQKMVQPDGAVFEKIVGGTYEHMTDMSALIDANRGEGEHKPFEPLLQAVLLCGAYELTSLQSTDAPIIISDYVNVGHAFFDAKEPSLINAILDSIRKVVR